MRYQWLETCNTQWRMHAMSKLDTCQCYPPSGPCVTSNPMSRCVKVGAGRPSPANSSSKMSTARVSMGSAVPGSVWGGAWRSSLSRVSEPWWVKALCRQSAKAKRRRGQVAERAMPVLSWVPTGRVESPSAYAILMQVDAHKLRGKWLQTGAT